MVNSMEERLIQVLEECFKQSCVFYQSKPWCSESEVSGDFYTRLCRAFKLYGIPSILSRDNVQRTFIYNGEVQSISFKKLRYSNVSQDELIDLIRKIQNTYNFNFSLYNLEAKLNKITFAIESFKIFEECQ